jgi:uncharacterized protein (TIGR02145 family)
MLIGCEDKPAKEKADSKPTAEQVTSTPPPSAPEKAKEAEPAAGTITDHRDKKTYKFVKIGKQIWMAKNLNYEAKGSKCHSNKPENCTKYGRLYNWKTAMEACPSGWHLPSNAEWDVLVNHTGSSKVGVKLNYSKAGAKLKATSGWNRNGNGTDEFGFSALPGGSGGSDGSFGLAGNGGHWWSATESGASNAHTWNMIYRNSTVVKSSSSSKSKLYSVRCLKDKD